MILTLVQCLSCVDSAFLFGDDFFAQNSFVKFHYSWFNFPNFSSGLTNFPFHPNGFMDLILNRSCPSLWFWWGNELFGVLLRFVGAVDCVLQMEEGTNTRMWQSIIDNSMVGTGVFSHVAICGIETGKIYACNPHTFDPTVAQVILLGQAVHKPGLIAADGIQVRKIFSSKSYFEVFFKAKLANDPWSRIKTKDIQLHRIRRYSNKYWASKKNVPFSLVFLIVYVSSTFFKLLVLNLSHQKLHS